MKRAAILAGALVAECAAYGCRGPDGVPASHDAGVAPATPRDGALSVTLAPLPVDGALASRRTALVEIDGRAEVFTSVTLPGPPPRTIVSSRPVEGPAPWTSRVALSQLLPPPPAWDAEAIPGGAPRVVIERAGGALNRLSLLGPGGEVALSSLPLGSYGDPRFVRRVPAGSARRALTAILDGEWLVAFEVAPSGACATPKVVGKAVAGVAVRHDGGHALFFKEIRGGLVRGESTSPGVLREIDLGPGLDPLGPVMSPLGDTVVYEIDADAIGDQLVVVATLSEGLLVMVGAPSRGAWSTMARQVIPNSAPLFWPSVLATADGLRVAAVEIGGRGDARILVGRAAFAEAAPERARP